MSALAFLFSNFQYAGQYTVYSINSVSFLYFSMHTDFFTDKRVTVMGLGLLGRGVGDAAYIAEAGAAEVVVTDLKTADELADSVNQLSQYGNVKFVLGEHREEDFQDRDLILVAAGVPADSPYLTHARTAGVRLVQSAALFAELADIPVIGVTGTRGKSMVTHMIHHCISYITGESVLLGGNIRGVSNLQLLPSVTPDGLAVMELDSWQLQGWGWAERSPQVAIFTNFMPDHLNYYRTDGRSEEEAMAAYFADKANIFRYQEGSDVFVTTPDVLQKAQAYARSTAITIGQGVVLADLSVLPDDLLLATPGKHNRMNAALAYKALEAVGLTDAEICDGLASFPGVPGRLEYRGTIGESASRVYNDNNATTPQATIAALEAVGTPADRSVVLIAGGADKGLPVQELASVIGRYCKQLIVLPGTGTDVLLAHLDPAVDHVVADDLSGAVSAAVATATATDTILFSPGFASFGLFQNEYERNDQFVQLIQQEQQRAEEL